VAPPAKIVHIAANTPSSPAMPDAGICRVVRAVVKSAMAFRSERLSWVADAWINPDF
jgi:hypothetical protein